jgi:uncharacterized membrane protein
MVNPAKALAEWFVRRSPTTLLAFGLALSFLDSLALYAAASKEGVLHIDHGVGLLNNYGLFSTILGNAVFLYLGKKYYNAVCSIRASKVVIDSAPIERSLSDLTAKIEMRGENKHLIYLPSIVGVLAWLSNVSSHILGSPEARWGHKVFDSPDHPLTFWASRLHNLYTWVVIMPFVGYVIVFTSDQLRRAMARAARENALKYDLLNPDQRGGFVFVDKAAISFNGVVALVYLQITMHIETFKMNSDHFIAYLLVTVLLVAINRIFFSNIYSTITTLRLEALNRVKDNVFKNDAVSFDVLKYCYEKRISVTSVVNFAINPGAVVVSGAIKLWPYIAKTFS